MSRITANTSRVLQKLARYSNPVVRSLLAGKAHSLMSRRLILVTFTGRRTGRSYTTPVSYVREGTKLLVPGGGGWWKNLGSGPVTVRLQGSWLSVTPQVISEPTELSEVLGRMMAANPALSVFTGIRRGPGGGPNPQDLERERRRGFVVVQFYLEDQVLRCDPAPLASGAGAPALVRPPHAEAGAGEEATLPQGCQLEA